jgi:hypothetical protein
MKPLTAKVLFEPVGLGLGLIAGTTATFVTRRVWTAVSDRDDLPAADDADNGWTEVLAAAALQAMLFALARTAVRRWQAVAIRRATADAA